MFDEDEDEKDELMILSDNNFMNGNPIIKGTHLTVEHLLRELAKGMSVKQILEEYPDVTSEGVKAALKFAAESVRFDHVTPYKTHTREEDHSPSSS
jgi:uncharacterized protein (DUF433 family)